MHYSLAGVLKRPFRGCGLRLRTRRFSRPLIVFSRLAMPIWGRLYEARATIARLRAITPEVMVNYPLPFRDPGHRELYFSSLRLALGESIVQPGPASPRSEPNELTP